MVFNVPGRFLDGITVVLKLFKLLLQRCQVLLPTGSHPRFGLVVELGFGGISGERIAEYIEALGCLIKNLLGITDPAGQINPVSCRFGTHAGVAGQLIQNRRQ